MKVNITVVATKTLITGFEPSTDVAMLPKMPNCENKGKLIEDSTGRGGRGAWQAERKTLFNNCGEVLRPVHYRFFGSSTGAR
jgi:hypothetical protein